MDDNAGKIFLSNYEKFMKAHFQDTATGKRKNFREVLKEKILSLESALLNMTEYKPYVYY